MFYSQVPSASSIKSITVLYWWQSVPWLTETASFLPQPICLSGLKPKRKNGGSHTLCFEKTQNMSTCIRVQEHIVIDLFSMFSKWAGCEALLAKSCVMLICVALSLLTYLASQHQASLLLHCFWIRAFSDLVSCVEQIHNFLHGVMSICIECSSENWRAEKLAFYVQAKMISTAVLSFGYSF